VPLLFNRVSGVSGSIDVPRLGVPIAEISSWTLTRRGEMEPGTDTEANYFDLRAILSRFTQAIFDDPEYDKRVILVLKGQKYLVTQAPGQRMALTGRSLVMEKVELAKQ
jgi:hypothetical protein